ncbi:hypothetical protein BDV25DRAFT_150146 [Aspergillus avenaceus]|uniref:Cofilin n=1 Tax=Aspergillus avenaceus TaxID=36643 RepID=A0A5N6U395_ASPAV|nr:hypothetical protein BDV25DRAFT_150146 [Aspergillus avenaceus]
MSMPSGVSITNECFTSFNDLRSKRGASKPKFIIYKISDDATSVVVDEVSTDPDYETFLQKLSSSADDRGNLTPRYAVYDVEYDLGEDGKRCRTVFISWVPSNTPIKLCMLYASTKEQLRHALDVKTVSSC